MKGKNQIFRAGIFLLFFFLISQSASARHIIGGVVSYDCMGNDTYRITFKMYRDCNGGGALFDSDGPQAAQGTATVYQGSSSIPFITTIVLPTPSIETIEIQQSDCVINATIPCVEEGVYTFDVRLPKSDQSYFVVYQRCCRNNIISNIVTPGDVGATFVVEVNPLAQETCNDSPIFTEYPPLGLCVGESLIYDHSAIDPDGNATQLVYELCAPYVGGGTAGTPMNPGSATAFNGVVPNPDAPPPYQTVTYRIADGYAFNRPLNGNPTLRINPNTGVLTGTPQFSGFFVVGICVKEFLNGELLSETRRDFQFIVDQCERKVVADIEAEVSNGGFELLSCGENTVDLENRSRDIQFINDYLWTFDVNGSKVEGFTRDFTITFPEEGDYMGTLFVNRTSNDPNCRDTAEILVKVRPPIEANFDFDYDTCKASAVLFTDLSTTGSGQLTSWNWDFADGQTSDFTHPENEFLRPGTFPVELIVTDINECEDDTVILVDYFPAPATIVVEPNKFRGCSPGNIFFNNLTSPIDTSYEITWSFGDGTFSDEISPNHIYDLPGIYDVHLNIVSPIGCQTERSFRNWIEIQQGPRADFTFTPEVPNNFEPTVSFIDQSIGAVGWLWDFNGDTKAFVQNPTYTVGDTGSYQVTLVAFAANGCTDTAIQMINFVLFNTYYIPNAFTPNDDGLNDLYKGNGILQGISDFQFGIWNRWGEQIFVTDDPKEGWNGRKNNTGEPSPKGVYICKAQYVDSEGERHELQEFVTLIR